MTLIFRSNDKVNFKQEHALLSETSLRYVRRPNKFDFVQLNANNIIFEIK